MEITSGGDSSRANRCEEGLGGGVIFLKNSI